MTAHRPLPPRLLLTGTLLAGIIGVGTTAVVTTDLPIHDLLTADEMVLGPLLIVALYGCALVVPALAWLGMVGIYAPLSWGLTAIAGALASALLHVVTGALVGIGMTVVEAETSMDPGGSLLAGAFTGLLSLIFPGVFTLPLGTAVLFLPTVVCRVWRRRMDQEAPRQPEDAAPGRSARASGADAATAPTPSVSHVAPQTRLLGTGLVAGGTVLLLHLFRLWIDAEPASFAATASAALGAAGLWVLLPGGLMPLSYRGSDLAGALTGLGCHAARYLLPAVGTDLTAFDAGLAFLLFLPLTGALFILISIGGLRLVTFVCRRAQQRFGW